jgi:hypothetical protein
MRRYNAVNSGYEDPVPARGSYGCKSGMVRALGFAVPVTG